MKKTLTMLAAAFLVFSALVLVGCGGNSSSTADLSNSKYVGTWKATTMSLLDDSTGIDDELTLVLNADGTAQMIDAEKTQELTWSETSDGFKTKGDTKLTFVDDGDNIKTKMLGVDIIFERQ